jgi:hypothetical protein
MEFKLQTIINDNPNAHIIMSEDASAIANTGTMLVRNTMWSVTFLRQWLQLRKSNIAINEQLGLELALKTVPAHLRSRITILPSHAMNSAAPPMLKQETEHKVRFFVVVSYASNIFCATLLLSGVGATFGCRE